jgi:hypothetical protein
MRSHWREREYWQWWWETRVSEWWEYRVSGQTKFGIAAMVAVAFGITGYLSAQRLAATEEAATFTTQRVVTVVQKTRAIVPPKVVSKSETVARPGERGAVMVRRAAHTVVVRAPTETVTETRTVRGPVQQRTDTVVRTETTDRPTIVTTPGTTETVTREVAQPAATVTETNVTTVTEEVTVTETGKKPHP